MNRGRHKKQKFPYNETLAVKIYYADNHYLNTDKKLYLKTCKYFLNEFHLKQYVLSEMIDTCYRVLEIQIFYNEKIIRTYKRSQFHKDF